MQESLTAELSRQHVNLPAEQAALGALLLDHQAIPAARALLTPEHFATPPLRQLFRLILDAQAEGEERPDIVTLLAPLCRARPGLAEDDARALLIQLVDACGTASLFPAYARQLHKAYLLRLQITAARDWLGFLGEADDPGEPLQHLLPRLRAIQQLQATEEAPAGGLTGPELLALELPPLKWVLPGFVAEGLSILAGKGKVGKSWCAYQIAAAIALGGTALGAVPVAQGRVLYLALEDTHRRLQDRLKHILDGAPAPPLLHHYNRWPRMQDGGLRDLLAWLRRYPDTRLIIIDTFAKIRGGKASAPNGGNAYDEDYRAWGELKAVADDHGTSILVLHHFNKLRQADDWMDQISGSIGISGAADGILGFFRDRNRKEATLKLTGRDLDDESDQALAWTEHGGPWALRGEAGAFARSQEQEEVLALLRETGKPLKCRQIAELLGQKPECVRVKLWRMANAGVLALDNGWYSPPPEPPPPEKGQSGVMPVMPVAGVTGVTPLCSPDQSSGEREDVTPVTPVTGITPITGITPNRDSSEPPPPAPPADLLTAMRREVRRLAADRGFPCLALPEVAVARGEPAWTRLLATGTGSADEDVLLLLRGALLELTDA